ncbi:MAG: esterase-like activity of phytase family protein [Novosphingobium sp.]
MARVILVLILCAAVTPGLLVRDPPRPAGPAVVRLTPLAHPRYIRSGAAIEVAGAWRLDSPVDAFGGYSALVVLGDGRLAAFSDRGTYLVFTPPGQGGRPRAWLGDLDNRRGTVSKRERDCEAVTRDAASGTLWAAYERSNTIVRLGPDLAERGRARPRAMRGWPNNRGPEAMVRLSDGRFVVLAEAHDDAGRQPGLLFAGDPSEGARAVRFAYRAPRRYRPTDMTELPDGRVLVLNRRLLFPWRFTASLVVADPGMIAARRTWRGREIARLAPPVPLDNYEGMAIAPEAGGRLAIWLISDDNGADRVQRTVLLKLLWRPERARPAR